MKVFDIDKYKFTSIQRKIFCKLLTNRGKIVSYEELSGEKCFGVWGVKKANKPLIDRIFKIRKKIKNDFLIENYQGKGYMLFILDSKGNISI